MVNWTLFLILLLASVNAFCFDKPKLVSMYNSAIETSGSIEASHIKVKDIQSALQELQNESPDSFTLIHKEALKESINSYERLLSYEQAYRNFALKANGIRILDTQKRKLINKMSPVCVVKAKATFAIFYINGMFNSPSDSDNSVAALKSLEKELRKGDLGKDNKLEVIPLYNEDESFLIQLAQVAKDKLHDNFSMFWDYYYLLEKAPDWYKKDYFDKFVQKVVEPFKNMSGQLNANSFGVRYGQIIYNDMANRGVLPIIIGHSQGGLYLNATTRYLESKERQDFGEDFEQHYSAIAVGSPIVNLQAKLGGSILREDDLVMKFVRSTAGTDAPNFRDLAKSADKLQHNFIKAYLGNDEIKSEFMVLLKRSIDQIEPYSTWRDYGKMTILTDCPNNQQNSGSVTFPFGGIEIADGMVSNTKIFQCRSPQAVIEEGWLNDKLEINYFSHASTSKGSCQVKIELQMGSSNVKWEHEHKYGKGSDSTEESLPFCLSATQNQIIPQSCK